MPVNVIRLAALIGQMVIHVVLLSTSLMVSLGVGWAYELCHEQCPLGANIAFCLKQPNDPNSLYTINRTATVPQWGQDTICGYCTYSAVVISVYSIIFMWFILLRSGWKEVTSSNSPPIRYVDKLIAIS